MLCGSKRDREEKRLSRAEAITPCMCFVKAPGSAFFGNTVRPREDRRSRAQRLVKYEEETDSEWSGCLRGREMAWPHQAGEKG